MTLPATATTTTKDVAKYIAKSVAEVGGAVTGLSFYAGMTVLIITRAFFLVGEYFEGLVRLFEGILGCFVVRITIRMIFHSHTAVGLFNVGRRCVFRNAQYFVVIFF